MPLTKNKSEKPSSFAKILKILSKDSKLIVSDELIKDWVLVADKDTNAIGYVFAKIYQGITKN